MNEQIRGLAKQAGMLDFSQISGGRYKVTEVDIEEFAELIVRECANIADHSNVNGTSIIGERIKQYFGVEE
jgi:hypothetical protein